MITVSVGMVLVGLCVLGLAVAIGIHDTRQAKRQAAEASKQMEAASLQDDPFRKAA